MGSLFGAKPPPVPPPPKQPDYEGIRRAQRRSAAGRKTTGRASTVLSGEGKLGG
jgi:hypothetical protein